MQGKRLPTSAIFEYVTAGNATFTLLSKATGTRYTYRMSRCKDKADLYFVSVLTGSNNDTDYSYMGVVRGESFALGRKSRLNEDTPSVIAFGWFWRHLISGSLPEMLECWHEGKCGRCGRTLTVPASVERGIGPECAQHVGHRPIQRSFNYALQ